MFIAMMADFLKNKKNHWVSWFLNFFLDVDYNIKKNSNRLTKKIW
jgi:hypothetical protein